MFVLGAQVRRKGEKNWDTKTMRSNLGCSCRYELHLGEQDQTSALGVQNALCFQVFKSHQTQSDQIQFGLYRATFYLPACLLLAFQAYRKKNLSQVLKRDEKLVCPVPCFTSLVLVMQLFVIHPMSEGHACPLLLYSPKKVSKGPNRAFMPL